jgi:sigma-B regulation protein RsbU (phosphoserine phosphatase)
VSARGSFTTRLIALLTLCAALSAGLGMLVDYRVSREAFIERLDRESEQTIRAVVIDMENWLEAVQGTTLLLGRVLAQREYSRAGLRQMLRDVVEVNSDIFGAAFALAPNGEDGPLGFAPYYYRRDGRIDYADLAGTERNYQQQVWYTDAVAAGKPVWVEPYFDEAGGKTLMTTFSVPVYRRDDKGENVLYGVLTADVTLAELHRYLQRLRLGTNGYGILLSRRGTVLSSGNPHMIMRHYSEGVNDQLDQSSWRGMFEAALAGRTVSQELACTDLPGRCVLRLGSLKATGWPVGVAYSIDEVTAPLREFEVKTALISLLSLLLMAGAVVVVTRRLTRPLTALALASDHIAHGELDTPLPPARGDDEVARLIRSFAAMKQDLKSYIADLEAATARRSRLEGELGAAREIQMAMLPHGEEACEEGDGYRLWARVMPARSVGGDLYNYLERDRLLCFAVGDVSDKGVPAALFMARAISLIQQQAALASDPATAMAALNEALVRGNDNCMFVTLFLGVLDLDSQVLHFASAGHTAPSLLRAGSATSLAQDCGPAIGLAPALEFPRNTLQLQAGDRLAIFTDGVDEAFSEQDEMFGIDRFNQALVDSRDAPVAEAGAALFARLAAHTGAAQRSDDICLMLLDIPGEADKGIEASTAFTRGPRLTSRISAWLQQSLAPLAPPEQARGDLLLVVEEIVSNIDKYGQLDDTAKVAISITGDRQVVEIEVRDAGIAFDPLSQGRRAELGADTDAAPIGGLGMHLISALTDHQSYRREGGYNILRIRKKLEKAAQ